MLEPSVSTYEPSHATGTQPEPGRQEPNDWVCRNWHAAATTRLGVQSELPGAQSTASCRKTRSSEIDAI
jgi:hypothetical protein